jgi:hypothetical protein
MKNAAFPKARPRGVALVLGGVVAGAALAGSLSAGAATTTADPAPAPAPSTTGPVRGGPDGTKGPAGGPGKEATADEAATESVKAAVKAERPDAEVRRVVVSGAGFKAFVRDGEERVVVTLDRDFAITATEAAPPRPERGEEVTGTALESVKAAVLTKYPGAEVKRVTRTADGTFRAGVTTSGSERLEVSLDASYAVTGSEPARGPGGRGPGGPVPGGPGKEAAADAAATASVKAAVKAERPDAEVHRVVVSGTGFRAFVRDGDERIVVTLDASFAITSTEAAPTAPGGRGPARAEDEGVAPTPKA